MNDSVLKVIRQKFLVLSPAFNERQRRLWAGAEARALGRGGVALVVRATGIAKSTVLWGRKQLVQRRKLAPERIRRSGGGRKSLVELDPQLVEAMEKLVEPATRGDPESPLRWTCKSTRRLARELRAQGHPVSHARVGELLKEQGYRLQANQKRAKEARIPTGMSSSSTSMPASKNSCPPGNGRFPSTPKRRI